MGLLSISAQFIVSTKGSNLLRVWPQFYFASLYHNLAQDLSLCFAGCLSEELPTAVCVCIAAMILKCQTACRWHFVAREWLEPCKRDSTERFEGATAAMQPRAIWRGHNVGSMLQGAGVGKCFQPALPCSRTNTDNVTCQR